MNNEVIYDLSASVIKEIEHWLAKFPSDKRESAIIPALMAAQQDNAGHLTNEIIEAVAKYIGMPKIAAYEVVSFYTMFEQSPVGKHKISVCTNIACKLRGSDDIVKHLEESLQTKLGETTQDGKFTLREVQCLGACVNAPMFQLDDDYHENLTPQKVDEIINKL